MSRHFYVISLAMLMMVFGSGQSTGVGCLDNCIRDAINDVFDGSGCLSDMIGDCGGCGDCMGDCDACGDCSDCMGDCGCAMEAIPGTYKDRPASPNVAQVRLTSHAILFIEDMLAPMLGSVISPLTDSVVTAPISADLSVGGIGITEYSDKELCASSRARSCGIELRLEDPKLIPIQASPSDQLELSLKAFVKLTHIKHNGVKGDGWPSREKRTTRTGIRYCNEDSGWPYCSSGSCFPLDVACHTARLLCTDCDRDCDFDFDTENGGQPHIGIKMRFNLGTSGVAPRADANIIDLAQMSELSGIEAITDMGSGCGLRDAANTLGSSLPNFIVHEVTRQVQNRIPNLVRTMLCEHPGNLVNEAGNQPLVVDGRPAACPAETTLGTYSFGMNGILPPVRRCGNGTHCLPMLLGMEGRLDLSSLLTSLAPGFDAVLDFIVAASGGATTPNQGLSVWLKGGIDAPTGASGCVPMLSAEEHPFPAYLETPDKPFVVPRAKAFEGNTHPTSNRPTDVMVGVSEHFINWAAFKAWESGAICLQIGSSTLPMLDPGLVGILFGADLGNLVFPAADSDSPLGVGLRPQKPPVIRFENMEDSNGVQVAVSLPALQLDFYAWSLDRYVRFVTFEVDIEVDVAVTVSGGKIALDLLGLDIPRAVAMNDSLLRSGSGAAGLISNVVGGLIPSFLGGSGPLFEMDITGLLPEEISLGDGGQAIPLPLSIELRDDALSVLYTDANGNTVASREEANGHAFLGVFVDFAAPSGGGGSGLTAAIDTQVEIASVYIPEDKSAFAAETFGEGELPRVEFVMSASAPAGVPVEYRYRLALGGWSDWQDSPYGVIESPLLLLQQDHTVFARARVKGEPRTEDRSSAQARFSTDVTAPLVDITAESKGLRVQAFDFHTRASKLEYRYREPEGEFSEWAAFGAAATALIDGSRDVEIEVRDEAGNIASNVAELRGLPPSSAAAGGCSCSASGPMAGSSSTSMLGFFAMVAMVGGMMYRLRRREEEV